MTITTRLTLYFQIALGLVLLGFSLVMYALATWHLHEQANRHLRAAMDLLVAAIEVHPDNVEWEPLERRLTLGDNADPLSVRWTLRDEQGLLIDCSENVEGQAWPANLPDWRLLVRRLDAGKFAPQDVDLRSIDHPTVSPAPLPENRSARRLQFLLTVGLSNAPIQAVLLKLALALLGVSLATWAIALVWGRWLCQRALLPVRQMAHAAHALQQTPESDSLLSVPAPHDELRELGDAFNGLLETLRHSIERQATFAGDASHQLRTPLTVTQTAVDVALSRERTPAEYQRVLGVVQHRTRELTNIVETLLTLARHSGPNGFPAETIDLNRACQKRMEAWRDQTRSSDLVLQACPQPVLVQSNALLVAQIIDNLLDNAFKYSEPGTPVTLEVSRHGELAAVAVKDRGDGIAQNELSQVFDPFFRSTQSRWKGRPGIGLGLAIASRFANAAGGHLEVSSVEGAGSEFRIVFAATAHKQTSTV